MADSAKWVGKTIAVVLWRKTPSGEDEASYFVGKVGRTAYALQVEREDAGPFAIEREWVERIASLDGTLGDVFPGAECILSLTVGDLPDDADRDEAEPTGLRWPEDRGM